jgi:thiol-disulfide isomerase/thioredoxin
MLLLAAGSVARHHRPQRRAFLLILALALGYWGDARASELTPWRGGRTPAVALKDIEGRSHTLGDYRGRVVLVNFWATWCEPCKDEMPSIQHLADRLTGRPFAALTINYGESEQKVADFLRRFPLRLPVLLDRNLEVARAWRVRGLPASFLVGRDGTIRYSVFGELDWGDERVARQVLRLVESR